ncbi:enoyl-CoA hydratase/isomerase family protein [Pelagibacterium montanilacus]|uniref:enoyl-CoA hydratase/isomerase family protein n=1 Tax=Pelagibacterium montanilacus TaxID=2185280 RepID=UPI000F8D50E1|nr:enoyl-CoA hydratase/isomerase family protein [Pelagibacterium montanilacus]
MSHIAFDIEDSVGLVRLARPEKLNALTPDMLRDLIAAIARAETEPGLRALVIHAEGRLFSVGADINIWSALSPEAFRTEWISMGHRAFDTIAGCRLPVIAALHGMALGGGLELALAADLRVADEDTTMALPEVSLGTLPGWGGTRRLPDIVGRSRAKQMVLTAQRIDAPTAERWGLVNAVSPQGSALDVARGLAAQICAQAPIAVQLGKKIIDGGAGETLHQTLEMLAGMATQTTTDLEDGIAAMRAKRTPDFRGR